MSDDRREGGREGRRKPAWWWGREAREVAKRATEEARRREQEALTGWWITGDGNVVLVRYDPVIRRFSVDGRVWPECGALRSYLHFCEMREGWSPLGDDATVRVREWLGLGS